MGMTIAEKILASHAGLKRVSPGELVWAKVDFCLGNDITAPIAIKEFKAAGAKEVFDRSRVALVPDHFTPNRDVPSAQQCKVLRDFARAQKLENYFEVGRVGVEHALLPEEGLTLPGELIIGADSHTCTYGALGAFSTGVGSTDLAAAMITGHAWFKVPETMRFVYKGKPKRWVGGKDYILATIGDIGVDGALYRVMEFTGEAITALSVEGRMTMSNMAIEAGGKAGIVPPDEKTLEYVTPRARRPFTPVYDDPDAHYWQTREYDVGKLEPLVACPHLPSNVKPASALGDVEIDQVFIGSCTNGRIEDLRVAAKVLTGRKVHERVRCIVIPATQRVWSQMIEEGLGQAFVEAGCAVSAPTCGPCLGGHMGILAAGERCVATSNRNFIGRMGHPASEIYLANPAVAAASAVAGRIVHPDEMVK